jgi:cobalt/nickel transport system permease protein
MAGTAAVSVAVLSVAVRRSRRQLEEREAPVLGAAHLLGGVLIGVILGPWAGMLVMFAVLLVQALLFQDGGIGALGANTLNMAVLGVGGGVLVYRWLLALLGVGQRRRVAAAAVAAFLSTLLVGSAVAAELAISGTVPLVPALVAVGGGHLLMGIGEALITGAILAVVLRARPELVAGVAEPSRVGRTLARATAIGAVGLAVVAAYLASNRPDALEAALDKLGLGSLETSYLTAPFADYAAPLGGAWLAAILGVVVVFIVAWIAGRLLLRRSPRT